MTLCRKCAVAPVSERDRFCIFCGKPARALHLTLEPAFVMADPEGDQDETDVCVHVRNDGQFTTRVRLLPLEQSWLRAVPPGDPIEVVPDGTAEFRLRVRAADGLTAGGRATVRVAAEEGPQGELRAYETELPALPRPRIAADLVPDSVILMDDPDSELEVRVVIRSHRDTQLAAVSSSASWAEPRLGGAGDGRVRIRVRAEVLRAAVAGGHPDTALLPLVFQTSHPDAKTEIQLRVPLRWPGELDWEPDGAEREGADWVYKVAAGRVHDFRLRFTNVGGRATAVTGLVMEGVEGVLHPMGRWPSEATPLEVGPGEGGGKDLAVLVDLRGKGVKLPLVFRIHPKVASGIEIASRTLRFEDLSRPLFDGAVALDFGTSYSCMAAWRPGRSFPETPLLRGGSQALHVRHDDPPKSTLASSILYTYMSAAGVSEPAAGGYRLGEVGRERVDPGATDILPLFSAKRWIGTRRVLRTRSAWDSQTRELHADDICVDIVASLIADAEAVLGARIRRCSLSHPVRFSPRQLTALRRTLESAGVQVGQMLSEPVAAALAYAVRNPPGEALPDGYSLLVFDVGGGTTDLAVFQIRDRRESAHARTVAPELLAIGGLRWAGGDDITFLLLRKLLAKDPDELKKAFDMEADDVRRVQSLLEDLSKARGSDDRFLLRLFTEAEHVKRGYVGATSAIRAETSEHEEVLRVFLNELDVLATARQTLAKAGMECPDRILLVGSSWQMQTLAEQVQREFPTAKFVVLNDGQPLRKEVVALGLCHAEQVAIFVTGLDLDLSGIPVLGTARVGYAGISVETGAAEFREILPGSERVGEWHRAEGLTLSRERRICILENTGSRESLERVVDGVMSRNPEIGTIGTVLLDEHLPVEVDEPTLQREGSLAVRLTEEHEVELQVRLGSQTWELRLDRPDEG